MRINYLLSKLRCWFGFHDWLVDRQMCVTGLYSRNRYEHFCEEHVFSDVQYRDAVCRVCDKTDLSLTMMIPVMVKAKQEKRERDQRLLADLRQTRKAIE